MASTSSSGEISVVYPQFCSPYPIDIIIKHNLITTLSRHKYAVNRVNGEFLFHVTENIGSIHLGRIFLDPSINTFLALYPSVTGNFFGFRRRLFLPYPAGNTILTLQQSGMNMHSRWEVFRGDNTEYKNLLFSVKRSSMFLINTEYDIFMATNPKENDFCDFKICKNKIYVGNTKNIVIAQMHNHIGFMSNKYLVNVYTGVDYVFIIALVVIYEEIQSCARRNYNSLVV
ncbi:protein LURP-one-related 15-like [Impatiens glandulifera]|uniref:protein LURP-one-related 15-like n=1 Tax=Impatiens glandulifera TaxID=253017 RepID=UPI001FB14877|nr:protein LURP-one-related 15-like [Impatiens glandulifera]